MAMVAVIRYLAPELEPAPAGDPAPELELKPAPAGDPAPELELKPAPAGDPAPELELEPAPAGDPAPELELEPAPAGDPAPGLELAPAPVPSWVQGGDRSDGDKDGDVDVLSLLRLRDQMKEQLTEYDKASLFGQENFLDHATEEKFIHSVTQDLQRDTEEVKVSFHNKTLALKRIQIMSVLRKKLKQDDEDSRLIVETMRHIVLLGRTIIKYQQQTRQKEQELIDIKKKRLSLKNNGEKKLQQIQTMRKKQKEKQASVNVNETEKMFDKLEKERQTTTVIQNMFQNIIIGSRVNWAEDPSLKAIVLQLEKNVYLE